MADYATNLFYASTPNEKDREKLEQFFDEETCDCMFMGDDNHIEGEFLSRCEFPEKEVNELIASLAAPNELYLRVLTHDLSNEYVSFRIFSGGKWNIKL